MKLSAEGFFLGGCEEERSEGEAESIDGEVWEGNQHSLLPWA